MEAFVACGYRGVELRNLNNCRLHLHTLRISDICTADGRHLTQASMEVQLDQQRLSPFTLPCTHRPEFDIRSFWRSALTKTLLCSTDSHRLTHPLGSFSPSVSNMWRWKYSPSEQRLFEPTDPCWDFYHMVSGRRQSVNRLYHLVG
jgi:hypothetical protein